jgi:hypothetical protein
MNENSKKSEITILVHLVSLALMAAMAGGRIDERSPPVATQNTLRVVAALGEDVRTVLQYLKNILNEMYCMHIV